MEEEAESMKLIVIEPIALGAGAAAGGAAAWGAIEVAKNHVTKNYQAMGSNFADAINVLRAPVERTSQEMAGLEQIKDKAKDVLRNTKEYLSTNEKLLIGTIAFVTVGVLVTAAVNAIQHREQPDAAINAQTVELAQQRVANHTPAHLASIKQ